LVGDAQAEMFCECLEILQTQIEWLIGREEELDEP